MLGVQTRPASVSSRCLVAIAASRIVDEMRVKCGVTNSLRASGDPCCRQKLRWLSLFENANGGEHPAQAKTRREDPAGSCSEGMW